MVQIVEMPEGACLGGMAFWKSFPVVKWYKGRQRSVVNRLTEEAMEVALKTVVANYL